MKSASEYFSEQDRKLIEDAVARAESETSGEIVPVVATKSGRYDRAEDLFGLLVAFALLGVFWVLAPHIGLSGGWGSAGAGNPGFFSVVIILIIGVFVGATVSTLFPGLCRPLIPEEEMREEVEKRAAEAFHRFRVRGTNNATGILIYISLFEKMARVMGDDAISSRLDQTRWEEILKLLIDSIKQGAPVAGFEQAILKSGELLGEHFPVQPGDKNELANELRIID